MAWSPARKGTLRPVQTRPWIDRIQKKRVRKELLFLAWENVELTENWRPAEEPFMKSSWWSHNEASQFCFLTKLISWKILRKPWSCTNNISSEQLATMTVFNRAACFSVLGPWYNYTYRPFKCWQIISFGINSLLWAKETPITKQEITLANCLDYWTTDTSRTRDRDGVTSSNHNIDSRRILRFSPSNSGSIGETSLYYSMELP